MQEQTSHAIGQETRQQPSLQSPPGTSVDEDGVVATAIASHHHPLLTTKPASIVVGLLDRAVETLGQDRAVAKDCIVQASAPLGVGPDHDGPGRGGLAPWQ